MEIERLQIRVKAENKELFQSVCQNQNIKPGDLFEKMLLAYCIDQDDRNYEIDLLKKMYEYVLLVVKGSNLPKDSAMMNDLIYADSRFDKLIENKINNGQK